MALDGWQVADYVYVGLWLALWLGFWTLVTIYHRHKRLKDPKFLIGEDKPSYWQKFKYESYILGPLLVHPDDPFSWRGRLFVLLLNSAIVLALSSMQFSGLNCVENQLFDGSGWMFWATPNFIIRVIQGSFTSMIIVWLFRFDWVARRVQKRKVKPCFLYDMCALCIVIIVVPILLVFCSDFWHNCAVKYVMAKWGLALAIEYFVAQPIMVWIQLKYVRPTNNQHTHN
eukprot:TRINITY_DN1798_c0_g1_i2.p1 TRINITY_DN1798_c0_g1~~TRINITY_DN1798_c0_g1_i2.p1  ORF type:complete len:228 (+),score=25.10 TRINITY_DN1798_c0_g1_i2:55-738(+)